MPEITTLYAPEAALLMAAPSGDGATQLGAGESWAPMSSESGQQGPWAPIADLQQRHERLTSAIAQLPGSSPDAQMLRLTQEVHEYARRVEIYTQIVHQVSNCLQTLQQMQV